MVKREFLNHNGSLMLVKVQLAAGFKGEVDQHPEEQLSYIEKGKLEFYVNGEKRILVEGDTQYIPSNVKHQVHVLEECVILDIFTPIRQDLVESQ
ncbi:cupin domain-containing protein [Metabacillus iocasae]|uniref:Quercetin dioxygenase-like cupin family protein n=1 Tax=Priestia iocasae TaxID=2291674 RepID=A0ABS2QYS3_9BACI|nr:cupin domain-containing protein [Metabacillus iocasae]MBM7704393.1 quercetin dioxygenase-like cupin family protein [Metabacillus iocasae]